MPADPADRSPSDLAHWQIEKSETMADCRVFTVARKTARHPGREGSGEFFVVESGDWVNVVAATTDDELVMVRQYRFGVEELSLEVPGGMLEDGEDPIVAARRELGEETGYTGGEAKLLASIHPNPAIQNNRCHLVMIEGVEKTGGVDWDEHEEIEVTLRPTEEVLDLARSGKITHALALNALWMFADQRRGGVGEP